MNDFKKVSVLKECGEPPHLPSEYKCRPTYKELKAEVAKLVGENEHLDNTIQSLQYDIEQLRSM